MWYQDNRKVKDNLNYLLGSELAVPCFFREIYGALAYGMGCPGLTGKIWWL